MKRVDKKQKEDRRAGRVAPAPVLYRSYALWRVDDEYVVTPSPAHIPAAGAVGVAIGSLNELMELTRERVDRGR